MTVSFSDVQRILNWTTKKIDLLRNVAASKTKEPRRGQVYWCEFGENIGSEQSKRRPALILSIDASNKTSPNVMVAPITTHQSNHWSVFNLNRPASSTVGGYVLLGNVVTVSKARLDGLIDQLTTKEMEGVENSLLYSIGVRSKVNKLKERIARTDKHLEEVKAQRNAAVDALKEIKKTLGLPEDAHVSAILALLAKEQE
ncbi:MAG: type II toxin-antitoxin system PemK/MazF family toxin [Tumebacillaceae bacterium]